jgi:putative FmdB family regulatory protein
MPIYEYKCLDCGTHLEKMQKISDAPLTDCGDCGGRLEKQISRAGFQFKGSGWYVTDYSNKGKSETKTETKTETAAEKTSAGESTAPADGASKTTDGGSPKTSKTD